MRKMALAVVLAAVGGCKSGPDMTRGGLELVYESAPSATDDARATAIAEAARKIATVRLSTLKIPSVARVDGRKLRVGLPAGEAAARVADAKAVLALVGMLELREVLDAQFLKELGKGLGEEGPVKVTREAWNDMNGAPRGCFLVEAVDEASARSAFAQDRFPAGAELMAQASAPGERLVLLAVGAPALTHEAILSARAIKDPVSTPATNLKLGPEGTRKLAELTTRIKGKKLAIVLDGKVTSAPVMLQPIENGELPLPQPDVGDRKSRERAADILAAALSSGPLPNAMRLDEERQVAKAR